MEYASAWQTNKILLARLHPPAPSTAQAVLPLPQCGTNTSSVCIAVSDSMASRTGARVSWSSRHAPKKGSVRARGTGGSVEANVTRQLRRRLQQAEARQAADWVRNQHKVGIPSIRKGVLAPCCIAHAVGLIRSNKGRPKANMGPPGESSRPPLMLRNPQQPKVAVIYCSLHSTLLSLSTLRSSYSLIMPTNAIKIVALDICVAANRGLIDIPPTLASTRRTH